MTPNMLFHIRGMIAYPTLRDSEMTAKEAEATPVSTSL